MELSVITDEIDNDLDHALDVMADYNIRAAELRTIWDKNIADAPREYWQRAKDALAARGAHVVGIASPFFKCEMPGEESSGNAGPLHNAAARGIADQIAVLTHCIEAARFFDANLIRVFSFWKRGPLTPEIEQAILDAFAEPVAIAEREGIILGLENEPACYLGTGAQTVRVLDKINSPALRSIWDPGNSYFDGIKVPFPDDYDTIKKFVTHVHVKDAETNPETGKPQWTVVGGGEIDYAGQIAALKADGFTGYLSLETHWNGPGGKEASSRACLEAMRSWNL